MACTYDEAHREWANSREPDAWQWDMGTAASMLRPFVLNEVRPEVTSGTTQTSNLDDLLKSLNELIISRVSVEEETFNRNESDADVESLLSNLSEGFNLIAPIEVKLHSFVLRVLKAEYGEDELEWWTKGIPKTIRRKCSERQESDENRCSRWDYLDFKDIIEYKWKALWLGYAESTLGFPGREPFLQSFDSLKLMRNKIMHPLRWKLIELDDFQMLKKFSTMVEQLAELA